MDVLLSIKPIFARKILEGEKRYEFRRSIFKNKKIGRAYIYATSPIRRIVGSFEVGGIIEGTPSAIWKECRESSGIPRKDFFAYFKGASRAFAIQIDAVEHFNESVDPYAVFDDFTPPQSFCYLPSAVPGLD